MTAKYPLIDCDTHCYETFDACTRYLPREFEQWAMRPVRNADGIWEVRAGDVEATIVNEGGMGWDYAYRPGSLKEMLRQMASGNPDEAYEPEPMRAEWIERAPREALMDTFGVEKAILFPAGMGMGAEHYIADTPAMYANMNSFNRWYDETWGFAGPRIYAAPIVSLRDLDSAIDMAEFAIDRGAKFVFLPTGPVNGRSPGDTYFDPVWSRLDEAGITLCLHIQITEYFRALSPLWGMDPDPRSWHMSAWQWMNVMGERAVIDMVSALIFDNLFGRFPNLRMLIAENGAEWVPGTLVHMDKARGMGRNGPWKGGKLTEKPSNIFKKHCLVTPYPEDDIVGLVEQLGGPNCLVMGSDFPHAEGVAEPAEFARLLGGLSDADQYAILRGNAEALFV
ncbi:MAG: amidohydrolase family protein [Acidimicrobiia bacterium]